MDEKYLDDLLHQASSEDDKQNKSFEKSIDTDIDIDLSDLGDLSLDELDGLDDIDLSGLDLDDIDFDDIDVMSLDTDRVMEEAKKEDAKREEDEDFNLDSLLAETPPTEIQSVSPNEESAEQDVFEEADMQIAEDLNYPEPMSEDIDTLLDNILDSDNNVQVSEASESEDTPSVEDIENMDLDDLFSALGIESEDNDEGSAYTAGQDELDDLLKTSMSLSIENGEFDDIKDISEVKSEGSGKRKKGRSLKAKQEKSQESGEKKKISEIIFGVPDEDDIEEERLSEAKRAEKKVVKEKHKAEKKKKKAAKDKEKKAVLELKKRDAQKKAVYKAEKRKAKEAEWAAELEAEKNDKKVSTTSVVIVFILFAALAGAVVFGSKGFNYTQVIKKATDYFERQRYRLAYDEVSGIDVKEKDEDLKNRIYTVMYVERLYESFENNIELGRPDKALDALLRGLEKYDEHYQEAVELGIEDDILLCRTEILSALSDEYGLSEEQAYEIMKLEGQEYTQTLIYYSEGLQTGE